MKLRLIAAFVVTLSYLPCFSQTCTMQGTYTVGPTGNYLKLTNAIAALRTNGVAQPVILELQPTYTSSGETFPLTFNNIPCIDSTRSVTIRPQVGATSLSIVSAVLVGTIELDNARFIHLDGRPGGVGTSIQLSISNTNVSGSAVRFINDASWNTLEYLNLYGVNTSVSSGIISFLTTSQTVTNGNSFNRISNCNITKGATNPANCIYASGTANKKNSSNEILNCSISDYFVSSGRTSGIYLGPNNTGWHISGNSIFHSVQKSFPSVIPIYINDTTSSGFNIENNFIGGSAPGCAGTAISYGSYFSIWLIVGTAAFTSVQNNTIANLALSGSSVGILLERGKFRCGDISGNIIGSQSIPNSITIGVSTQISYHGIQAGTTDPTNPGVDTCYIKNNKIGGIYAYLAPNTYFGAPIRGIAALSQKKGFLDISNNTVGSPSVPSSITNYSYGGDNNEVDGIYAETDISVPVGQQPKNLISNNTIVNLVGQPYGIRARRGSFRVIHNVVHHLYGGSADLSGSGFTVKGIMCEAGNDNTIISENIIHSLTSPATSINDVAGIDVRNSSGALIAKNYIHSFQSKISSQNDLTGINIASPGKVSVINNMIRLGLDTLGQPVSGNQKIFGIQVVNDSAKLSNNSVYIGGSGTGESATLMFPSSASNAGVVLDNIFMNKRSATQGSLNRHYAIRVDNSATNVSKLNFNIYYATGTNAYLGIYKGTIQTTIINWRKATRADSNSTFYDPHFANPDGTVVTGDLHLLNPTPAEGSGSFDPAVLDDIDNQDRSSLTPVDIGADAGNFIFQDGDAPVLTHDIFFGQPVVSSFVYMVKITDNGSGVDTSGANKPRMWYRKKYTVTSSWMSSPGNLLSGSPNGGTWGFKPDLTGLTLSPGDSIEYYFVAQDKGIIPNIGYSNIPGTLHTNVNSQTAPPSSPLRLLIYGIFPDTMYVGTGQPYTSLTKNGGLFQASHMYLFDSTHTAASIIITSDLLEDGTWDYTTLNKTGPLVTFKTNTATVKHIKADLILKNLIRLTDIKNVTIDGRVNGSGRFLQFTNFSGVTGWGFVCMNIDNSSNFSLVNTILESNSGPNETGSNLLSLGGAISKTLVKGNLLRHASGGAGLPVAGMWLSPTAMPDTLQVSNNEITNFKQTGILMTGTSPTGTVMLDSNHIYFDPAISPTGSMNFIYVNTPTFKPIITNNFIGGTAPYCGGAPLSFNIAGGGSINGMYLYTPNEAATSIQGNTIQNIWITQFGFTFTGITIATGTLNIGTEKGNTFGSATNSTSIINKQAITCITGNLSQNAMTRIENNVMGGLQGSNLQGIAFDTGPVVIKNNRILNSLAGVTSFGIPGYTGIRISTISNGSVEGNVISGLGSLGSPSYAIGMELGAGANEVVVSRNRVMNLYSPALSSPGLVGISLTGGNINIQNNQVSLSNRDSVSDIPITGIYMSTSSGKVYYNTVLISGTASGASNSYAIKVASGNPIAFFRNNLLYNERSGGSGLHVAVGDNTTGAPGGWPAGGSPNNNLFVTTDTSRVNEWRASGAVSMRQWRTLTLGDSASYASKSTDVPSNLLFISPSTGELNINNQTPLCWYVNGKAMPISLISGDFDSAANVRSTTIASGATDIGSDEFNTTTLPPALIVYGNHAVGGTEFFSFNQRTMASITWGSSGTLPSLGSLRYYSGAWPNDTTNNNSIHGARYLNAWWDLSATGGSNYSYTLTLMFDSSVLGKITDAATMVVNKRQTGTAGSWQVIHPNYINGASETITVNNQSSFSEFTLTDSLATLVSGVPLPDLVISSQSINFSTIGTGGSLTATFIETNQGVAAAPSNKIYFYLSADDILTPGANGDMLLGQFDLANSLAQNSSTGSLNSVLTIPCTIPPGNYKLFFAADGNSLIFESNENNNYVSIPVTITAGLTPPQAPLISATPGTTACAPATITLTASSANCPTCTYTWSSGASGPSIIVNSTSNYSVTATNVCGSASASQPVTFNSSPVVSISASSSAICLGSTVTLTAAGATSYSWTGPGLSASSGTSVNATPTVAGTATYNVTGVANGCSNSQSIPVNVTPTAVPTINITYTGCPSSTLNFQASSTNGGNNPQYEWRVNNVVSGTGTTFTLSNAQNNTVVSCALVSNANCAAPNTVIASETITCIVTGLPNINGLESYYVAPNPSRGVFVVSLKLNQPKIVSFEVRDIYGHMIYHTDRINWLQNSKEIDLSEVANGVYFLKVTINDAYFIHEVLKVK